MGQGRLHENYIKGFFKKIPSSGQFGQCDPKNDAWIFMVLWIFLNFAQSKIQKSKSKSKVTVKSPKKSHSVQLNHSGSDNHSIKILGNERGKKPLENFINGFCKKNCHYSKCVILDPKIMHHPGSLQENLSDWYTGLLVCHTLPIIYTMLKSFKFQSLLFYSKLNK